MYLGFCEKSTNINFYLSRGWNEKESREFIKKRQNTYNEEYFVNKYGEQEGKIKFLEAKKKHNDTFVNNYKKGNHKKFIRPSEIQYWINKGYTEEQSIKEMYLYYSNLIKEFHKKEKKKVKNFLQ